MYSRTLTIEKKEEMKRTVSLPRLKQINLDIAKDRRKERAIQRLNKIIVKRLYTKDIRNIKRKNNSFWHKSVVDRKLEAKLENLKRSKNNILHAKSESQQLLNNSEKVESSAIKKLKKLQDSMRQNIILPKTLSIENLDQSQLVRRQVRDLTEISNIEEEDSTDETQEILGGYNSKLKFVNTRIQIIMMSLPELRQKFMRTESSKIKDTNLTQKLENLTNLLEKYQKMKEKLISLIEVCSPKVKKQQRRRGMRL